MFERLVRRGLQALVPAGLLAALAFAVRFPVGQPAEQAQLLLLGRMVGERVRVCRDLTPEELVRVPRHMQAPGQRSCEQSLLPYRLRVWLDGALRIDTAVRPSGLRGDRPVYVQEALTLPPGSFAVRIAFDPEPAAGGAAGAEDAAHAQAMAEALARATHYGLERTLVLAKGQVARLELDEDARQWVLR